MCVCLCFYICTFLAVRYIKTRKFLYEKETSKTSNKNKYQHQEKKILEKIKNNYPFW